MAISNSLNLNFKSNYICILLYIYILKSRTVLTVLYSRINIRMYDRLMYLKSIQYIIIIYIFIPQECFIMWYVVVNCNQDQRCKWI